MDPFETGGTVLVAALLMIFLRVPVGLALGLAAFGGAFALLPATAAISLMSRVPYEFTASWEFAAVPLFLATGTIITRSGMADGLIILAERSLRRLPGGLAIAANFAGAGFGAASGSSLASSVLFLLLGMVLDPFGVMLLSVAVLLPAFERLGFDLVWMGIIIVKFIEIGLVTPPVGLNVFAAKSVAPPEIGLTVIFRGVSWFLLAEAVVMAILFLFPALTLWLPNNLLGGDDHHLRRRCLNRLRTGVRRNWSREPPAHAGSRSGTRTPPCASVARMRRHPGNGAAAWSSTS